ncbi:MAG: LamG domain-containing protein, partial [Verrucomicrobia bacterium]|nr:LamG domain-containing protein [Verrucomicrobiota bacterium]
MKTPDPNHTPQRFTLSARLSARERCFRGASLARRLAIASLFVTLAASIPSPASAAVGPFTGLEDLVGHWTFESGEELMDRTGNFPDLRLKGDAMVAEGKLDLNGSGTTASGWAVTDSDLGSYRGPAITSKTLVAWITLQGLDDIAKAGSAITLDRVSGDHFDGIIYAERQANRWMNGSSGFGRTADFSPGAEESATDQLIHLAITYEHLGGGQLRISGYRNGDPIGQYETGNASSWNTGDAEVFFGLRHGSLGGGPGGLDALLHEARLYSRVLSASEVRTVFDKGLIVVVDSDSDGLRDDWETENFGDLAQNGAGDPDGDGVPNIDELRRRTDPKKSDTDGDGLSDRVETETGVYVDATNTGTNPRIADTDRDGLNDGVETNTGTFVSATNTGTDPNRPDSDGDRRSDGSEVADGTDPTDPKDPPTRLSDLLVGHWTFEAGQELVDQAGKFPNLLLKGNATVANGKLDLNGADRTASGWAVTDSGTGSYSGPPITDKTLVTWVTLEGLEGAARHGSAMTLDRVSGDHFDGIIFAERQRNRWMSGSSGHRRTQDFDAGVEEMTTGQLTQIAVSYQHLEGGRLRVTGYRNGQQVGQY